MDNQELSAELVLSITSDYVDFVSELGVQLATIGLGVRVVSGVLQNKDDKEEAMKGLDLIADLFSEILHELGQRQLAISAALGFIDVEEFRRGILDDESIKDSIKDKATSFIDEVTKGKE
jgi:hypothetical protein